LKKPGEKKSGKFGENGKKSSKFLVENLGRKLREKGEKIREENFWRKFEGKNFGGAEKSRKFSEKSWRDFGGKIWRLPCSARAG